MTVQWTQTNAPGPDYCHTGQHFVTAGTVVWKAYVSPTTSRMTVCHECAQKEADHAAQ